MAYELIRRQVAASEAPVVVMEVIPFETDCYNEKFDLVSVPLDTESQTVSGDELSASTASETAAETQPSSAHPSIFLSLFPISETRSPCAVHIGFVFEIGYEATIEAALKIFMG